MSGGVSARWQGAVASTPPVGQDAGRPELHGAGESMHDDIDRILYTDDDIQNRIRALARDINQAYPTGDLVLLGVLSGSLLFLADLARALDRHVIVDFIAVSSYEGGTQSTGVVRLLKDLSVNIEGK